ncbi:MAG TPA: PEP-CTERM sorting domain-containing protein [Cellvibrionaceae bacterium]|nr:PEP-CTERM sorting domain-containing protein [Cellvibrionaceae bacterium]
MLSNKNITVLLKTLALVLAGFGSAQLQANTVEIPALANAVVLDGNPNNTTFAGVLASELNTSGRGSIWLSLLQFDLGSLGPVQVNSASLALTTFTNHNFNAFSHQVFSSSDDSWTEASINGVNRPADSSFTLLSATLIDGNSQTYTWDVLAGGVGTDGLGGSNNLLTLVVRPDLSQNNSSFGPHFWDRTAPIGAPKLTLDISPVPEPASWALLLAGGAFILRRKRRTH